MIELKQATKQCGRTAALKNITLSIEEPGIYCLLVRNGAGKTNAFKIYCRAAEYYRRHH